VVLDSGEYDGGGAVSRMLAPFVGAFVRTWIVELGSLISFCPSGASDDPKIDEAVESQFEWQVYLEPDISSICHIDVHFIGLGL